MDFSSSTLSFGDFIQSHALNSIYIQVTPNFQPNRYLKLMSALLLRFRIKLQLQVHLSSFEMSPLSNSKYLNVLNLTLFFIIYDSAWDSLGIVNLRMSLNNYVKFLTIISLSNAHYFLCFLLL